MKLPKSTNRRKILKSAGVSVMTASALGTTVSASERPTYVGFAYNPVTGEVLGNVEAQMSPESSTVSGRLKFDGDKAINRLELANNKISFNQAKKVGESKPGSKQIEDLPNEAAVRSVKKFRTDVPSGVFKSRAQIESSIPRMKINSVDNGGFTGYIRTHDKEKVAYSLMKESGNVDRLLEDIRALGGGSNE